MTAVILEKNKENMMDNSSEEEKLSEMNKIHKDVESILTENGINRKEIESFLTTKILVIGALGLDNCDLVPYLSREPETERIKDGSIKKIGYWYGALGASHKLKFGIFEKTSKDSGVYFYFMAAIHFNDCWNHSEEFPLRNGVEPIQIIKDGFINFLNDLLKNSVTSEDLRQISEEINQFSLANQT